MLAAPTPGQVRTVLVDTDGNFWVGLDAGGIGRRRDGQWEWFTRKNGLKILEQLGLKEGDEVEVVAADSGLAIARTPDRLELLANLRKFRGVMPADFKFDREEANQRRPHDKD